MSAPIAEAGEARVEADDLDRFCRAVLAAAGCDEASVDAATSRAFAQMAERFGIDPPQPAMHRPE